MKAVEITALSFSYRRGVRPALAGISFSQREGEVVGLIGRTGAGKSSWLMCLNRIIPNFFPGDFIGRVSLFGQDIAGRRTGELAGVVGVLLQDFETQLFSTAAELDVAFGPENLGLSREEIHSRVEEALELVGLKGVGRRDPATLSGGQKQRLALASVLALKPRILCLDEATTDLDPQGKQEVTEIVRRLAAGGTTLLLVGHEAEELLPAERIVLLEQGKIIQEGPAAKILSDPELLAGGGVRPADSVRLAPRVGTQGGFVRPAFTFGEDQKQQILAEDRRREERLGAEIIRVESLVYRYPNGVSALSGVDFRLRAGDFVAIVGPNGSGKTTLVKHLNGLLRPSEGAVWLDGRDLRMRKTAELGREIGFVFQNPDHQIFSSRVYDEVAFGPRNYGLSEPEVAARVQQALELVNLSGAEERNPFLMTKGERQRLAVASILAPRPRVLILDEPTTGLDYPEQVAVMEMLKELNRQGRTVVIVTHALWLVARYARRTVLMAGGRILFDGPTRQAFSRTDLLEQASLRQPEIVALGLALGFPTLTEEEFLLGRGTASA